MAIIPSTDKFHVVDANVPTTNKGSATANAGRQAYTMQDVIDTVGSTGGSQPVFSGLSAQGTDNTTTSILSYGINVFTTIDGNNYATKLPQPITGQSVTVVNNGPYYLWVWPSNVGGQINDLPVDTPVLVPNDGVPMVLTCTVNPSPGQWSTANPLTNMPPLVYEWTMDTSVATGTNGVGFTCDGIPGVTQNALFGNGNNPPLGGVFGNAAGDGGNDVVAGQPVLTNTAPPTGWYLNSGSPHSWQSTTPNPGYISSVELHTNIMFDDVNPTNFNVGCGGTGSLKFVVQLWKGWQGTATTPPMPWYNTAIPIWGNYFTNLGLMNPPSNPPGVIFPPIGEYVGINANGYDGSAGLWSTNGGTTYNLAAGYIAPDLGTNLSGGYNNNLPTQTLDAEIGDMFTFKVTDLLPIWGNTQGMGTGIGAADALQSGDSYYFIKCGIQNGTCIQPKKYKFRMTINFAS